MTKTPKDIGDKIIADMRANQLNKLRDGVRALSAVLSHVPEADRAAADAVLTLLNNNLGDVVAYLHSQAAANIANVLFKDGVSGELLNPKAYAQDAVAEHQKSIINTEYEKLLVRRALGAGDELLNLQLNENAVAFDVNDEFYDRFNPEKEDRVSVPQEPTAAITVMLQHLNDNLHGIARTPFGAGFYRAIEAQAKGYNSPTGKSVRGHGGKNPIKRMEEDQLLRFIFVWAGWAYVACRTPSKESAIEAVIALTMAQMPQEQAFLSQLDPKKLRTRLREKEGDAAKGQRESEYNKLFSVGENMAVWLVNPALLNDVVAGWKDSSSQARAEMKKKLAKHKP